MKKLMLLASVAACAACFADGLASANIVGWADKGLQNNAQAIAPFFFTVGAQDSLKNKLFNLSDLVVAGYENNYSSAEVNIQILDSVGRMSAIYRWNEGVAGKEVAGWYTAAGVRVCSENGNDVVLKQGTGLWISAKEGLYLKQAGEVFMDDVTFSLSSGAQMLGNPYATGLKLSSIVVSGYADNYSSAQVNIQILDSVGRMSAIYRWNEGVEGKEVAGWYNAAGERVCEANGNDVVFPAGQGLWVTSKVEGLQVVFYTPFEK